MLSKIADYFIPISHQGHIEDRRAARLLVFTLGYSAIAECLSVLNAVYIHFTEAAYLLFAAGLFNLLVVFLFRQGLSLLICTNLCMSCHAVTWSLQSWWGGGLECPSTTAMFLLPTVTMLLTGKRNATFWLLVALSAPLFFYVYEHTFGQLPVRYDVSQKGMFLVGSILGEIIVVYIITLVFDQEKNRAISALIQKNDELLTTQAQLIQKEKMASLGELTAGIAHEIQNPLNFVNNFSDISIELFSELKDEKEKGDGRDEELEESLFRTLEHNLKKISHHGHRASNIVHGMLEHSRASTGELVLTDINALAEEYLRLAYHGQRAKDSTFNAMLTTSFDAKIPQVLVVPQDVGRVLLNLFHNAFYAVHQRRTHGNGSTTDTYQPKIWISTRLQAGKAPAIEIRVRDNGTGIPEAIQQKIFQPFFTTKPTGEGTGLGLSLSYEIITKGHGGNLFLTSVEGKGSEFVISLPVATV
ncbi:sensor histidine kinase [Spirosoma sp. KNUC1025]|uniref:sensor histidine kinase n=1 Tax=Spirosoma sp. KNUC1025 TaxID=2894082 RepID=UPI0038654A92